MGREVTPEDGAFAIEQLSATVGEQLRSLRRERGLTLEDLARRAGVSTGLVSTLERGKANPSFTSLALIAHALDVPVGRLFHVNQPTSPVVRRDERRRLTPGREPDGAQFELLIPDSPRSMEAVWMTLPPGHDTSDTPFSHNGEEFGLVISGYKDVYLNGTRHSLGPGDSIFYKSTTPHWYANPSDEVCVAIWVTSPPSVDVVHPT